MNQIDKIKYQLETLERIIEGQSLEIEKDRNYLMRVIENNYTGYLECPDNIEFDIRDGKLVATQIPDGLTSNIEKINKLKKELGL